MRSVAIPAACAALALPGCVSVKVDAEVSHGGRVEHVVLCWLKNPRDIATRDEIIRVSKSFDAIPGVLDVRAGTALPSKRAIVDDSFDIGLVVVCRDAAALKAYLDHPMHVAAAEELIRPAARRIVVYDIVE